MPTSPSPWIRCCPPHFHRQPALYGQVTREIGHDYGLETPDGWVGSGAGGSRLFRANGKLWRRRASPRWAVINSRAACAMSFWLVRYQERIGIIEQIIDEKDPRLDRASAVRPESPAGCSREPSRWCRRNRLLRKLVRDSHLQARAPPRSARRKSRCTRVEEIAHRTFASPPDLPVHFTFHERE